jgi:hypothetical protein
VFKGNLVYDLPFGRGRRFGGNAGGVLDRVIGGWQVGVTSIVHSGQLVDFGNVRLVGMTPSDVQDMFQLRFDDAGRKVWMLPEDVIENTIRAFSVSATSPTGYSSRGVPTGRYFAPANGPDCIETGFIAGEDANTGFGDCGLRSIVVTGPKLVRFDLSVVKRVPIKGRVNAEFRAGLLNAFNTPWFNPVTGIGSDPDDYRVTGTTGGAREVQLVWRINW